MRVAGSSFFGRIAAGQNPIDDPRDTIVEDDWPHATIDLDQSRLGGGLMGLEDATCWVVRAGKRAMHAAEFVDRAAVSVAWDWEGVGDLGRQSDADIFFTLEAAGHPKPAEDLRDLRIFTTRMALGDLVVVPDTSAGDLLFGEICGEYTYMASGGPHRHSRGVRWFGRLATDQIDGILLANTTNTRMMIRRLPEQVHWQRLAGEVNDFLGRDPADVPKVVQTAKVRRSSAAAKPRKSVPKAPSKHTLVLTPDKLCPACGLLRAPSMFPGDDEYCRDCA